MGKKALVTGITGQDGSYLAELLLSKGYEVHGVIRRASTFNTGRLDPIYEDPHADARRLSLHYGDLSDASALARLISKVQPDEIYNLAAQSHVRVSFDAPEYTTDIAGTGRANPTATFLSAGMMLDWLGDRHGIASLRLASKTLVAAVEHAFAGGNRIPYEMGGSAGTSDIVSAVMNWVTEDRIHDLAERQEMG